MLKILVSWLRWKGRRSGTTTFLPSGVHTIVAVELTRLGDFITILPAVRALRRNFPAARMYVVTTEAYAPLLELCDADIDVIRVRRSNSLPGFLRALRIVRKIQPSLVCSMGPSNRNAALALASGAPFIVGYLNGTDSLTPFLGITPVESIGFNGRANVTFTSENIQDRPWKVLQSIGLNIPRDPLLGFPPWKPDERRLAAIRSPGSNNRFIVMHPFSGWKYRSWPAGRFRILTERILRDLPQNVVFLCGEEEKVRLTYLREAFSGNARVSFFPSGDILDSAALIWSADLFIGNDSGPLHLASLLGVPAVGLFGPALPEHTAPFAARGRFLYGEVPCSPCTQTRCTMPSDSCMNRITVDDVYDAASELLGGSRTDTVAAHG